MKVDLYSAARAAVLMFIKTTTDKEYLELGLHLRPGGSRFAESEISSLKKWANLRYLELELRLNTQYRRAMGRALTTETLDPAFNMNDMTRPILGLPHLAFLRIKGEISCTHGSIGQDTDIKLKGEWWQGAGGSARGDDGEEGRRIKVVIEVIEETIITCGHVGDVEDARLKLCNSRDNDDNENED